MPKPEPINLQAVIPDKASAIAFDGGAGDKCRVIFDIYEADRAEIIRLLDLRGDRLVLRIWREDELLLHAGKLTDTQPQEEDV